MIVVMGASGRVGGAALGSLAATGLRIRAISRTAREDARPNVEWAVVDANDVAALAAAFDGAEAIFVLKAVSPDTTDMFPGSAQLSTSIAKALSIADVPHAVALSSKGAQFDKCTAVAATLNVFEKALNAACRSMTFLRPAFFMGSWIPVELAASETGYFPPILEPPSKDIDTVSASDVGEIAARHPAIGNPGVVNITDPKRYCNDEAIHICSMLVGCETATALVLSSKVAAAHEAVGLSQSCTAAIAGMHQAINRHLIPFERAGTFITSRTTLLEVSPTALRDSS